MRYRSCERRVKLIVNRPHGDVGKRSGEAPRTKGVTPSKNKSVGCAEKKRCSGGKEKVRHLQESALKSILAFECQAEDRCWR